MCDSISGRASPARSSLSGTPMTSPISAASLSSAAGPNSGLWRRLGSLVSVFGGPAFTTGGSVSNGLQAIGARALGFEGGQSQATTALCSSVYGGSASPVNSTVASGNAVFGGAAGGGVDNTATVRAPGVSTHGGSGGAASGASSGTAGSQPGGGGGATQTGAASGAGGDGALRIWGIV